MHSLILFGIKLYISYISCSAPGCSCYAQSYSLSLFYCTDRSIPIPFKFTFYSIIYIYTLYIFTYVCSYSLSYIGVAMNSRDQYEIIGLHKISRFINNLVEMFSWKTRYKCIKVAEKMQYLG